MQFSPKSGSVSFIFKVVSSALALVVLFATLVAKTQSGQNAASEGLAVWFSKPAKDWEREGLPLGNGALGVVVMGGIERDRLQFNEKTLWEGGPGAQEGYRFGRPSKDFPEKLAAVQAELLAKGSMKPEAVAKILGQPMTGYGHYQSFGNLDFVFPHSGAVSDYRRTLDIENALATVSFQSDGVEYKREYFVSWSEQIIAARFSASRPGNISFSLAFTADENRSLSFENETDNEQEKSQGLLRVKGKLHNNGLKFQSELAVLLEKGEWTVSENQVEVKNADSVVLLLSAATDYAPNYPHYRGQDPATQVSQTLLHAKQLGYKQLRLNHIEDHSTLFQRVKLDLATADPNLSVAQLLEEYGKGDANLDRHLETLLFQFGRYLLIASSRKGSLPANLQGVWNNSMRPPWNADYHVNINLQMNYWPALSTNLSETAEPLYAFIESLQASAEDTARIMGVAKGWTVFLNTNIYGYSGLIEWPTAFWQPEAAAWLCRLLYDHYLYTGDETFLRERAYPLMKGASEYWLHSLKKNKEGEWLVVPSFSPEHGDFGVGAAMSQQIVYELLSNTEAVSQRIGDVEFAKAINTKLKKLDHGLRIGSWGQLQEWREDRDDPDNTHRHVSHLYALYPGLVVSPSATPDLADAARVSLNARGDGGTGWSKAWKINMWARLRDGDRAHRLYAEQIKHSTLPNLWGNHPPFQIDGNFGASAGVAELLVQSRFSPERNEVELALLPALPAVWPKGAVEGLRTRGALELSLYWNNHKLQRAVLKTQFARRLKVETTLDCDNLIVVDESKKRVEFSCKKGWVNFNAREKHDYIIQLFRK